MKKPAAAQDKSSIGPETIQGDAKAVELASTATLEEKLDAIRDAATPEIKLELRKSLTPAQKQALWQRFAHDWAKRAPPTAHQAWNMIGSSGFKGGKYAAKNEMLWAWVDDNKEWSKGLIEEWSAFTQRINKGEEGKWISIGRLICLVGEEEATMLMDELRSKPHPTRDGHKLYFYSEEFETQTVTREKGIGARTEREADIDQTMEFHNTILNKGGSSQCALEDHDDSADATGLKKRPANKQPDGSKKPKKQKTESDEIEACLKLIMSKVAKTSIALPHTYNLFCKNKLQKASADRCHKLQTELLDLPSKNAKILESGSIAQKK